MAGTGGRRPGAGRKPSAIRTLRRESAISQTEKKIIDHLPVLADKLISLAEAGDRDCLKYLVNRIMGKPTQRVEAQAEVQVISHARDILRSRITDRSARVGPPGGPGRPE